MEIRGIASSLAGEFVENFNLAYQQSGRLDRAIGPLEVTVDCPRRSDPPLWGSRLGAVARGRGGGDKGWLAKKTRGAANHHYEGPGSWKKPAETQRKRPAPIGGSAEAPNPHAII